MERKNNNFLQYLPELYQSHQEDNSATMRYLSIFQRLYEELENEIENSHELYSIETAPDEFIEKMANWVAIPDMLLWGNDKLREVLKNIHQLYRTRGTLDGLSMLIKLFCNGDTYFAETYHTARYANVSHLYPDYNNRFTLWIIMKTETNLSETQHRVLEHLIEKNKPVHVDAHLVILKKSIVLDGYSFLGINSMVTEYPDACLNGDFTLGYGVLG